MRESPAGFSFRDEIPLQNHYRIVIGKLLKGAQLKGIYHVQRSVVRSSRASSPHGNRHPLSAETLPPISRRPEYRAPHVFNGRG